MKILVTCSSSLLGRYLVQSSADSSIDFIFTDCRDDSGFEYLDVTDCAAVECAIDKYRPDMVVYCGTTEESGCSDDFELMNVRVPGILASAVSGTGALLVYVSSAEVFDGRTSVPYTEESPVCPTGIYGKSMLAGEEAVAASGCRFMIIRTCWLYGAYGDGLFRTFVDLTSDMPEIHVPCDRIGAPTFAGDLADALVEIAGTDGTDMTGVYNFTGEGVCSFYDFVKEICDEAGNLCRVQPVMTDADAEGCMAGRYMLLDNRKFKRSFAMELPYWRDSLRVCTVDFASAGE